MFWDNYVSLCSKKGVSPNAVAAKLGKSSGSVTAWKNGTVPRETTLKKIADYFEISVDALLYGEKEKKPAPSCMNNLRLLREERNLSQADLGSLLSMSQNTISQYESEKRKMDPETLLIFSEFFGVSTDYLLGVETQKEKQPGNEAELSDLQKQAVEYVLNLSDDQLMKFIKLGKVLLGE